MTIDGTGFRYSITNSNGTNAINITSGGVTIKNLSITTNGSAYSIDSTGSDLTVTNCNISSTGRGINFYTSSDNSILSVTNTTITNPSADEYKVNYGADNRGIATGNVINGHVSITSCNIQGFKYGINVVVDDNNRRDSNGTVFDVLNTSVLGWAAFNVSCADTIFNVNSCVLTGVNKFSTGSNDYSVININEVAYNYSKEASVFNIVAGEFHVYRYGQSNQTAAYVDRAGYTQYNFISTDDALVEIYLYGAAGVFTFQYNTTVDTSDYVDGTGYYDNVYAESRPLPTIISEA